MKQLPGIYNATPKNLRLGFRIHLLATIVLVPASWIIWFLTDTTYPWPLWANASWATGLIFHYLGISVFKKRQFSIR